MTLKKAGSKLEHLGLKVELIGEIGRCRDLAFASHELDFIKIIFYRLTIQRNRIDLGLQWH